MKVDYVISGSGTRLYAMVGVLRVLFRAGYLPRRAIGTSGPGLILLYIAAHYDPRNPLKVIDGLEAYLRSFILKDLLDRKWFRWPRYWHGIYKGDKILAKIRSALPADWNDMKFPVYVVTSARNSDAVKVWGVEDGVEPALAGRATMSLPIFDAVKIKGRFHTDGGTRANYFLSFFGNSPTTLGIRFRPPAPKPLLMPGEEGELIREFKGIVDFHADEIGDMVEANDAAQMALAPSARTLFVDCPGSGLDFDVDDAKITAMIKAGEASAMRWLAAQAAIS